MGFIFKIINFTFNTYVYQKKFFELIIIISLKEKGF